TLAAGDLAAVAEPALALVALRAIRGDAAIVAANAPEHVVVDLIQQVVGTGELAGAIHVVVHHAPFDRCQSGLAREAGDLHVTEAVIGEARLPDLRAAALQGVDVGGLGAPQVGDVERPVRLQRFGMAQRDLRALGTGDAQAAPADQVLPHVVDVHAPLEPLHADWL